MQVHTFISDSANEAVAQIRSQLGPSAVVLSVRKLPRSGISRIWGSGQIEVTATLPEEEPAPTAPESAQSQTLGISDEPAMPNAAQGRGASEPQRPGHLVQPQLGSPAFIGQQKDWSIARYLIQSGLLPLYAEQVAVELAELHGTEQPPLSRQIELAQAVLRRYWRPMRPAVSQQHIFIGPSGSGKSTVLCKWLAQNILGSNQPATVFQLDTHAANTSSLPSLYSEILGTQFERALPEEIADLQGASFIDLPGISMHSERGKAELSLLLSRLPQANVHLVLNGAYETSLLLEQTRFFAQFNVSGIILTHMDEDPRWGKFWNLLFGSKLPVQFFSSGQNIPGEFISATADRLFQRQFRGK